MSKGAEHSCMADDGRLGGDLAGIEKTSPIQMGQVDQDAGVLAAADEVEAPAGQTRTVVSPASVRGITSIVRGEMNEANVPDAPPSEGVDLIEVAFEGVGPFDSEKGSDRTVGTARRHLLAVSN